VRVCEAVNTDNNSNNNNNIDNNNNIKNIKNIKKTIIIIIIMKPKNCNILLFKSMLIGILALSMVEIVTRISNVHDKSHNNSDNCSNSNTYCDNNTYSTNSNSKN